MRPRGSYGDIRQALLAAADQGPGSYSQLACRAQVGFDAARRTVSRMVGSGELVRVSSSRPVLLARPVAADAAEGGPTALEQVMASTFWQRTSAPWLDEIDGQG
jgi:hypothetical protein